MRKTIKMAAASQLNVHRGLYRTIASAATALFLKSNSQGTIFIEAQVTVPGACVRKKCSY